MPLSEITIADHWIGASDPRVIARWKRQNMVRRLLWKTAVGSAAALKRFVDIAGGLGALIALSPLIGFVALCIKIEDRGPVFYKQLRYGLGGQTFWCWKIRSMVTNADELMEKLRAQNEHGAEGVTFKMKRDPRITRVGGIIRKLSIDEMPQFWNVVLGEMSLVGPRPHVWKEVSQYNAFQLRRLSVKPGITCLWQVGGRSDIPFEGQVRLDLQYIYSQSLMQDLKILFATVPAVLLGRGAY